VDTPTGDKRKKLAIGKASILNGLAFSPDGRWLAVVTDKSRRIQRFDTRTGSAQASSPIPTEYVHDVVWHPKSSQLAAVDFDDRAEGTVVLVDVPARVRRTQSTRMDASNTATYSPSGAWLAVGDYSGRIRLFDPATGALKMALSEQLQNGGMIACSPKDPSVVVSHARYGLLHWNLAKGTLEVMGSPPRDVEALVWVKESDHLVATGSRGQSRPAPFPSVPGSTCPRGQRAGCTLRKPWSFRDGVDSRSGTSREETGTTRQFPSNRASRRSSSTAREGLTGCHRFFPRWSFFWVAREFWQPSLRSAFIGLDLLQLVEPLSRLPERHAR